MRLITHLTQALRRATIHNPDIQAPPACILWPDRDRQWQAVIPRLQAELPELLALGDYAPEDRTGPAIWLRCVIARRVDDLALPAGHTPILYLPGVSRQDLRAVEECPDTLKPLAELQYRGVIWSQLNAKDWTVLAFLKSEQGGLALDVAQDSDTRHALQLALHRLLDEELELLRGKRLAHEHFNTLLTGGDPARGLLQWLDLGDAHQQSLGDNEWQAFAQVCRAQLAFEPERDGLLAGASRLAAHEGPWRAVWERYGEAPHRYPRIPGRIRQCQPPLFDLLASAETSGGWPQWNDEQEQRLRHDLLALARLPPHEARQRLQELEPHHAPRRELPWTTLGEAPLALALQPLARVAAVTAQTLNAGTVADLQSAYLGHGWQADEALLAALACVVRGPDLEAVTTALQAVYLPWLEASARHLQQQVAEHGYPGGDHQQDAPHAPTPGQCLLFVDGLRLDLAQRLATRLAGLGHPVQASPHWAALPSVTATAKPAVSPVRHLIAGDDDCDDFEPAVAATGQSLRGGYHLKKLLGDHGWRCLARDDPGDGAGNAWCEFGDIDAEGHHRGWQLAHHADALLAEIVGRIQALLAAGWHSVWVVTDHGWLLLPGKLPVLPLPRDLTVSRWGRCAALKPGVVSDERLYPWFWNPRRQFALADGVSCYGRAGDYAHGGLSLQECLTLQLQVGAPDQAHAAPGAGAMDLKWTGLRCTVAVEGQGIGLTLDVRTRPGDPGASVVLRPRALKDSGSASVVVENEELAGQPAFVVLLAQSGELVAQRETVIGG